MDRRLFASIFIVALVVGLGQCVPLPDSDSASTSPRSRRSERSRTNAGTSGDTRTNSCMGTQEIERVQLEMITRKLNATKERMAKVFIDFNISDGTTIGVYPPYQRFAEPGNEAGVAIANSHYYLRCFIGPLAEALKNETLRNVSDRLPGPIYWKEFHASFGDIADAANGIYNLVKGTADLPGHSNCEIPRLDESCPPLIVEGLVDFQDGQDYTDRELILGAIALELSNLCIDLNGYVRQVLGEI